MLVVPCRQGWDGLDLQILVIVSCKPLY